MKKTTVDHRIENLRDVSQVQSVHDQEGHLKSPRLGLRFRLSNWLFEKAYGKKANGTSKRTDQGEEGRFRCFDRAAIGERGDNLDISWLKDDDATGADDLPEPDEIASLIRERLSTALEEMDALSALLEGEEVEV